jgi:hypothetical protein
VFNVRTVLDIDLKVSIRHEGTYSNEAIKGEGKPNRNIALLGFIRVTVVRINSDRDLLYLSAGDDFL